MDSHQIILNHTVYHFPTMAFLYKKLIFRYDFAPMLLMMSNTIPRNLGFPFLFPREWEIKDEREQSISP